MSAWTYCLQDGKAAQKIVPPRPRIPWWKGPGADSEEKHEPASDIDTVMVDSLKALDPNRPIIEADIICGCRNSRAILLKWQAVAARRVMLVERPGRCAVALWAFD